MSIGEEIGQSPNLGSALCVLVVVPVIVSASEATEQLPSHGVRESGFPFWAESVSVLDVPVQDKRFGCYSRPVAFRRPTCSGLPSDIQRFQNLAAEIHSFNSEIRVNWQHCEIAQVNLLFGYPSRSASIVSADQAYVYAYGLYSATHSIDDLQLRWVGRLSRSALNTTSVMTHARSELTKASALFFAASACFPACSIILSVCWPAALISESWPSLAFACRSIAFRVLMA